MCKLEYIGWKYTHKFESPNNYSYDNIIIEPTSEANEITFDMSKDTITTVSDKLYIS